MLKPETNFACLMDLLGIKSADICRATGADKTLVSRWRSGKRRLMPERGWAGKIASCFLEKDAQLGNSVVIEVLRAYYPSEKLDTDKQKLAALERWLTTVGQKQAEYRRERDGLLGLIMDKIQSLEKPEPVQDEHIEQKAQPADNTVVYGVQGVQGSTLQAIELVLNMTETQEIVFVCPEGLDMYTRDERFGPRLMDGLMELFAAGHRMSVVLRTDYKMTDVSAFSGRWLVAHLLGYIRSFYFDEFHKTYNDKMLAVVGNSMAMRVNTSPEGIFTAIYFDYPTVADIYGECECYKSKSKQRFHYSLFEQPDGFLRSVVAACDKPFYQFARLPHFGLAAQEVFQENFQLSDGEMSLLKLDFPLLLTHLSQFDADAPVRHMFCEDDIENALLKSRHVSQELSAITSRRVNMSTQRLAEQLLHIKTLLEKYQNYEVCFMPDEVFKKLTMQIAAWGDRAAIGWIAGGKSTACRDYTNVNALTGFCGMVWEKIPGMLKLRRTALRKINVWLKKAQKYGLNV